MTRERPVPRFLQRLYRVLHDPRLAEFVHWAPRGDAFLIPDRPAFVREVLAPVFRHSSYDNFVRLLNMYCFAKVRSLNNHIVFEHHCFLRNRADLLPLIRRREPSSPGALERRLQLLARRCEHSLERHDLALLETHQASLRFRKSVKSGEELLKHIFRVQPIPLPLGS